MTIEVRAIDPAADSALAERMLAVQLAAYHVEADLIDDDRIPTLPEDVEDLRLADLQWFGAFDDDDLAGIIGWTASAELIDIDRLAVLPDRLRRGIGRALLQSVLALAGGRTVLVSTGKRNAPARALYERVGFTLRDHHEVLTGLWISRYAKVEAP